MGQSELLASALAGGFLLYLAMNNRLAAYWALLTGGAPAAPASAASAAATPTTAASVAASAASGVVDAAAGQALNAAGLPGLSSLSTLSPMQLTAGSIDSFLTASPFSGFGGGF